MYVVSNLLLRISRWLNYKKGKTIPGLLDSEERKCVFRKENIQLWKGNAKNRQKADCYHQHQMIIVKKGK